MTTYRYLIIDNSADVGIVAFLSNEPNILVVYDNWKRPDKGFAKTCPCAILSGLLSKYNISLNSLDAIIMGIGPGLFSGIRNILALVSGVAIGMSDSPKIYPINSLSGFTGNVSEVGLVRALFIARASKHGYYIAHGLVVNGISRIDASQECKILNIGELFKEIDIAIKRYNINKVFWGGISLQQIILSIGQIPLYLEEISIEVLNPDPIMLYRSALAYTEYMSIEDVVKAGVIYPA